MERVHKFGDKELNLVFHIKPENHKQKEFEKLELEFSSRRQAAPRSERKPESESRYERADQSLEVKEMQRQLDLEREKLMEEVRDLQEEAKELEEVEVVMPV